MSTSVIAAKKTTMTDHEDGRTIKLYIPREFKADYSCGNQSFSYTFVTHRTTPKDEVRNPSNSYRSEFGVEFADLTFWCLASTHMNGGKPYAYSVEFREVFSVSLWRAELMVKMLKRINTIEAAFPVRPESFGQYVQLICIGLKVRGAVKAGVGNNWHTETEHTTWRTDEIQWLVDSQISEFLETHKEAMERARR